MNPRLRAAFLAIALLSCGAYPLIGQAAKPLQVGDMAPDYVGRDGQGKAVHLSDYRGKVVVLSFWATWCGPCLKELPVLEKVQRAAAPHGLQVLAVNWKEESRLFRKIRSTLAEYQLTLVSDESGRAGASYGVTAIPHMLLVGKDGRITFINIGYGESVLDKVVDEINKALAANFAAEPPATH